MTKDDEKSTERAILEGIKLARLDRQVKREARAKRARTLFDRTYDKDPEEVVDAAILCRMRDQPYQESTPDPSVTDALRRRLLQYPGIDDTNVDDLLFLYEDRAEAKQQLRDRGCNNALAEAYLDRQGYPRPPGWHSVFFYPDSNRPRNSTLLWLAVMITLGWLFLPAV